MRRKKGVSDRVECTRNDRSIQVDRQRNSSTQATHRGDFCPCGGGCPRCRETAQAKLKIGPSGEAYEREVEAVNAINPALLERIQRLRTGGKPLPPEARAFFESRFATDFSQVRVHDDDRADSMAKEIGARAFTAGEDIVFHSGEYDPRNKTGKSVLAHELVHVAQQRTPETSSQAATLRRLPIDQAVNPCEMNRFKRRELLQKMEGIKSMYCGKMEKLEDAKKCESGAGSSTECLIGYGQTSESIAQEMERLKNRYESMQLQESDLRKSLQKNCGLSMPAPGPLKCDVPKKK